MELIETIEVGLAGASSIEFTSIPQDGTDLVVIISQRASNLVDNLTFNSDTASNYKYRILRGTDTVASTIGSDSQSYIRFYGSTETAQTANTFGNTSIYISNYTSSSDKSVSIYGAGEHNGEVGTSYRNIVAGSYLTSSPITSISWNPNGGTIAEHTTASLYKITAENNADYPLPQPKATGGVVTLADGYWVHTFNSSDTFTPNENLIDVEYVIVGGGGGAGCTTGGGGGGGGYRSSVTGELSGGNSSPENKMALVSGVNYPVVVGGGGGGAFYVLAQQGNESSFNGVVATGGGAGAGTFNNNNPDGGDGGSGGGAKKLYTSGFYDPNNTNAGGSGIAGQGFDANESRGNNYGTGGGGAGGTSQNDPNNDNGGDDREIGGVGLSTFIKGFQLDLAGGGSGSYANDNRLDLSPIASPGFGAGTGGHRDQQGGAGEKNTGGGAGASAGFYNSLGGGSGIVIVRYAA